VQRTGERLAQGLRLARACVISAQPSRQSFEEASIMHACPLPTDSILRRHFEQLASSAGLPQPPQDSVLLRHYRQLLDARLAQHPAAERPTLKAAAQPDAAVPASKPNPAPQSAATPEAPPVVSNQPAQA